jgi:phospholipid/cholesterol/gamma-HCH transport system substrate-binding protein
MGTKVKNMLIGVFVLVALICSVSIIMFLKPSVGDGKKTVYVRFSNINKIGVGTRVVFAGKPVGEVVAVNEIFDAREQPADILGRVYFYQLTLKVDSSVKIYDTDLISLQTSGLLGEKSVAIIPKVPPKGVTPRLITNEPIYADSVDPIENAFAEISELANEMEITFSKVNTWLDENDEHLSFAVDAFGQSMDQIRKAVAEFNDERIIEDVKTVTHNLAAGNGTLGKLINDDELYLRMQAVMSKINTLMNDINHYGILFHLNKGWQRTRTQRINWINALDNPTSFKSYFETEVDQINTAMGRISALVDRANTFPKKCDIMTSDSFKEDFAELLRQAGALSDSLKLFNEQLMQPRCR